MKWAIVLAAALVAGCMGPDGGQDGGPDGGPDGGSGSSGTGGSGSSGTGGSGSGSGGSGSGFAPQTGSDTNQSAGIRLTGTLRECAEGYCVNVTASNEGTTRYVSSICVPPFEERMERDGQAVQHREPMSYCMAFGTQAFAPGTSRTFEASWNGTVYEDGYRQPERGGYDWIVAFTSYAQEGGDGRDVVEVSFHVLVGVPT